MIIVGVLLLALIATATIFSFIRGANTASVDDEGTLVLVNGQAITQKQLDFHYNLLPPDYRAQLDKSTVLEQIIDEELVVQAAKREGLGATLEEVNIHIQNILSANQVSIEQLEQNLALFNVTIEEFEWLIDRQISIDHYTNKTIVVPEPTDEQLMALYDLDREQYTYDAQVTARHILISTQRTDAALVAKELYDKARAGDDFCVLVEENSDDRGSRETCGEYTFPRGYMVPEFEDASFTMAPGEFRLVQTTFGYHIIEKLADTPGGVKTFEEVRESLSTQWRSAERVRQYKLLVSNLREASTIQYPGVESDSEMKAETLVPVEPPAQELNVAAVQPVQEPELAPVETTSSAPGDVLGCIAQSSTLYGTGWSSDTQAMRDLFAGGNVNLAYVACDLTPDACSDMGIQAYPTWIINGETYMGRLSVEELRRASGC